MKNTLLVIVALLAGCATTPTVKSVAGEYKIMDTGRLILLENGIVEGYHNGNKETEGKWRISKNGELHTIDESTGVWIINSDSSITPIAYILKDGKQEAIPKEEQMTLQKIKPLKLTAEEKVVGSYKLVHVIGGKLFLGGELFLQKNRTFETKDKHGFTMHRGMWKLLLGGIEVEYKDGNKAIYRNNKDGSLTEVRKIDKDGKREDIPKLAQPTFKKIK